MTDKRSRASLVLLREHCDFAVKHVSTHHTLLSWTFGSIRRMVMRDSLLPVDDSHLSDIPVRCVKRTGVRMVRFGTAGGDGGCGRRLGCGWLGGQIGK